MRLLRIALLTAALALVAAAPAAATVDSVRVPAGSAVTWESRERFPTGLRMVIAVRVNGVRAPVVRRELDCVARQTPVVWRLDRVRVERLRRRTCGNRRRPLRMRIENDGAQAARVRVRYRYDEGGSFPDAGPTS